MSRFKKVNHEIKCATQQVLVTRTNTKGEIVYCNRTFLEVNGFKSPEVIHKPHSIVRHPDMPKSIFKIIWLIIAQGFPIQAVIKNKTNDGHYYWTLITIKPQKDRDNNIISYVAHGKQAPPSVIKKMKPLYKMMKEIEESVDIDAGVDYLESYLKEQKMTYAQYIKHINKNRGLRCFCDFIKHAIFK